MNKKSVVCKNFISWMSTIYKMVQNQRNGEKDVSFSWGFDLTFTIAFQKIYFDNIVCFFETISVLVPISASMVKSNIFSQVAQNQVKVATDGNIFEDRTFFEVPLKNFLLTSWPCSRYLKGPSGLVLYVSKKIVTIR